MNRLIIDGFNVAYRSYFSHQDLKTSDGLLSGCIYGFLSTLRALKNRFPDFDVYVAWDTTSKRKKDVFPEYKANRVNNKINLPIRDIKRLLTFLKVIQVEFPGEEADDVIASLVNNSEGGRDYIYTSDKDMLQLVKNGKIIVISPKMGPREERFFDEDAVKEKFGVSPEELACFLAFKGDKSDNIPGTSVPSKILVALTHKYSTPMNVYANIESEQLTTFQRNSLMEKKDQIILNLSLISLIKDLQYEATTGISDEEGLSNLLEKYEIKSISAKAVVELFEKSTSFNNRYGLITESLFEDITE
jgi:DNA polymerase-1